LIDTTMKISAILALVLVEVAFAQDAPYDVFPDARPPYYRVRYDASPMEGELQLAVQYTIWIPPNVKTLRGVVVHQHGCGEGSCKSGLTGAFDLICTGRLWLPSTIAPCCRLSTNNLRMLIANFGATLAMGLMRLSNRRWLISARPAIIPNLRRSHGHFGDTVAARRGSVE